MSFSVIYDPIFKQPCYCERVTLIRFNQIPRLLQSDLMLRKFEFLLFTGYLEVIPVDEKQHPIRCRIPFLPVVCSILQ